MQINIYGDRGVDAICDEEGYPLEFYMDNSSQVIDFSTAELVRLYELITYFLQDKRSEFGKDGNISWGHSYDAPKYEKLSRRICDHIEFEDGLVPIEKFLPFLPIIYFN